MFFCWIYIRYNFLLLTLHFVFYSRVCFHLARKERMAEISKFQSYIRLPKTLRNKLREICIPFCTIFNFLYFFQRLNNFKICSVIMSISTRQGKFLIHILNLMVKKTRTGDRYIQTIYLHEAFKQCEGLRPNSTS